MSVVSSENLKILLPRSGPDEFWQVIRQHYAGEDARKWRYLAMLALRENAGWPLDSIGEVFGHNKGHVTRCLTAVKSELRDRFRASPDVLELDPDLCAADP
jgi:hypothetical protein